MQIINFPADTDERTEERIREGMQADAPLPRAVKDARSSAYKKVREMARANGAPDGKQSSRRWRWRLQTFVSAAAAAAIFSMACIANPAFAAKIPLVGGVFETLGHSLGFSGDFGSYAVTLGGDSGAESMAEAAGGAQAAGRYSQTDQGMTITLSEQYCSEETLYVSLLMTTEEPFPASFQDQDGALPIELWGGSVSFSFNPETETQELFEYLNGRMLDDHTYAGVLQLPLRKELSESSGSSVLPDQFTVDLQISQIVGDLPRSQRPEVPEDLKAEYEQSMQDAGLDPSDEAYASFTEEEKDIEHDFFKTMMAKYYERYPDAAQLPNKYEQWWIDGSWSFSFDVTVNRSDTEIKQIDTGGACDIGKIKLTRTPFEITLSCDRSKTLDYYLVLLDADGKPFDTGKYNGSVDTLLINGQDVSKVTLFVCDYNEYMDELKGYYYNGEDAEKTYAEYLGEHCIYSETVEF